MAVTLAKKNHYNPCFWTAHWNQEYLDAAIRGGKSLPPARDQMVWALSVKSGQIFRTTTDNIHYDKGLCVAEITREASEEFCRRNFPEKLTQFLEDNATAKYPICLDFESILTGMENSPAYQTLVQVLRKGNIQHPMEKGFLAGFVVLQCFRSHAIMNSMIEMYDRAGIKKFEHFIYLKWSFSDREFMFGLVAPLATSRWTIYTSDRLQFPLCDSAILSNSKSIMVALSPKLLLEIDLSTQATPDSDIVLKPIDEEKWGQFRRRTIGNTFREIIGPRDLLEEWRLSKEFQARIALLKDIKQYNQLVHTQASREVWHINSWGNRE